MDNILNVHMHAWFFHKAPARYKYIYSAVTFLAMTMLSQRTRGFSLGFLEGIDNVLIPFILLIS